MADSISRDGASVAYCNALLKFEGCARMPWNSGFKRSDVVCDCAGRLETTSNSAGANAPATLFHDTRQVRSFTLLPARRFGPAGFGSFALLVLSSARCPQPPRNLAPRPG